RPHIMSNRGTTRRGFLTASGSALGGSLLCPPVPAADRKAAEPGKERPKSLPIALVQMRCDGDPSQNLEKAIKLVKGARSNGAELIVLPELFANPYFCREDAKEAITAAKKNLSVTIPGPLTDALAAAAKANGVVLVGGSVFEEAGDKYFNTSVI